MALTPEFEKYYTDRFSMCSTDGWRDLMDDLREILKATDTTSGITDLRQLGVKQGEVSILNWLLSIQQVSEQTYKELQDARDE
jgi:hypothetical protein